MDPIAFPRRARYDAARLQVAVAGVEVVVAPLNFFGDGVALARVEVALQTPGVRVSLGVEREHVVLVRLQPHAVGGELQKVNIRVRRRQYRTYACALAHAALHHIVGVQRLHVARLRQRSRAVQQVAAHVVVVLLAQRPPVVLIALLKHRAANENFRHSSLQETKAYTHLHVIGFRVGRYRHGVLNKFPLTLRLDGKRTHFQRTIGTGITICAILQEELRAYLITAFR